MRMLALIFGILGGLSAAMGFITAIAEQDVVEVNWTFWLALGAVSLLVSIAFSIWGGSAD